MKLIFRGHEDRYAVEQSLLAFFAPSLLERVTAQFFE